VQRRVHGRQRKRVLAVRRGHVQAWRRAGGVCGLSRGFKLSDWQRLQLRLSMQRGVHWSRWRHVRAVRRRQV
jgi:hypothetical protein